MLLSRYAQKAGYLFLFCSDRPKSGVMSFFRQAAFLDYSDFMVLGAGFPGFRLKNQEDILEFQAPPLYKNAMRTGWTLSAKLSEGKTLRKRLRNFRTSFSGGFRSIGGRSVFVACFALEGWSFFGVFSSGRSSAGLERSFSEEIRDFRVSILENVVNR